MFDVFLSYNSQDKPLIQTICCKLRERGIEPWFDEEQVLPGEDFQDKLQQAITQVKAAAIYIGKGELGAWQKFELNALIRQCVSRGIHVIPVLLPGVSSIPDSLPFLQANSLVQFISEDDIEALDKLETGITGLQPKHKLEIASLSIFLCCADEDKTKVKEHYQHLKSYGVQPWFDEEKLLPGQDWKRETRKAIQSSNIFLVFYSNQSLSQKSGVQNKLNEALEIYGAITNNQKRAWLMPVFLEEIVPSNLECLPEDLKNLSPLKIYENNGFNILIRACIAASSKYTEEVTNEERESLQERVVGETYESSIENNNRRPQIIRPAHNIWAIGGAEDQIYKRRILHDFFTEVGAGDARVAILTSGSRNPSILGVRYQSIFLEMGAEEVQVWDIRDREQTEYPGYMDFLENCTGIFMTGGDQLRLVALLADTPLMDRLRMYAQLGQVSVAGTGAAASALGHIMIAGGISGNECPRRISVDLTTGLGFLPELIIDSHFYQQNRIVRLLSAVGSCLGRVGVGIDEDTCALFHENGLLEIVGSGTATIIDSGDVSETNASYGGDPFNPLSLHNLRVHILKYGDFYDLRKRLPIGRND